MKRVAAVVTIALAGCAADADCDVPISTADLYSSDCAYDEWGNYFCF